MTEMAEYNAFPSRSNRLNPLAWAMQGSPLRAIDDNWWEWVKRRGECTTCRGTGYYTVQDLAPSGLVPVDLPCGPCGGSGHGSKKVHPG